MTPTRHQLRRTAGWRLPEGVVKVDRSTRWGNPFEVGLHGTLEQCVAQFETLAASMDLAPLRGKSLACWCKLDAPCHADVLLRLANAPQKAIAPPRETKLNPMNRRRALRYIGSKIRIAPKIAEILRATGAHTLVDVFGGSGAMTMNSGFVKRIFNDIDSDVVEFFRVLQDSYTRRKLRQRLSRAPMSRQMFDELADIYRRGGLSFRLIADPVERAAALFYRSSFAFGGKIKNGGFGASTGGALHIKEIPRFRKVLEELESIGDLWRDTVIEHLDFRDMLKAYGSREGSVLYCDPPYFGTEVYFSSRFSRLDHLSLAVELNQCPCAAVVSYYDCPEIRAFYPPENGWVWHAIQSTRNPMVRRAGYFSSTVTEMVIAKPAGCVARIPTESIPFSLTPAA